MMSDDAKVGWIIFSMTLAVIVSMFFGLAALNSYSCSARWEKSGLQTSWGFLQGCQVQQKDGTWIPERVLRQIKQ